MSLWDKLKSTDKPLYRGPDAGLARTVAPRAVERLGTPGDFRTVTRPLADSATATVWQKGDKVYVTVDVPQPEAETTAPTLTAYMESGQEGFAFPGESEPTRADPAQWKFLDIDREGKWLGEIKLMGGLTTFGKQVAKQKPGGRRELTEGMESLAIGYPRSSDAAVDAQRKEDYTDATVMKKITTGLFSASYFPGKMRLFIQAQYGAQEKKSLLPGLVSTEFGGSFLLEYYDADGESLVLGLWIHGSPGIYTDDDGYYWLLNIGASGNTIQVYGYPLIQDEAGTVMRKWLKRYYDRLDIDTIDKVEGYIFAHSTLKVGATSRFLVGQFDTGMTDLALYNTPFWGWKFNWDGSEAKVIAHAVVGAFGDVCYHSRTFTLNFTYDKTQKKGYQGKADNDGVITLTGTMDDNGDWLDSWAGGNNLLWVPYDYWQASMDIYSITIDAVALGVKPEFNFTDIPFYGFYQRTRSKGGVDTWIEAKLSRRKNTNTVTKYNTTGNWLNFNPPLVPLEDYAYPYHYVQFYATDGYDMEVETLFPDARKDTLTIGDWTADFTSDAVAVTNIAWEGSSAWTETQPTVLLPPGPATWVDWSIHSADGKMGIVTGGTVTFGATGVYAYAMVVPSKDCSALYVATYNARDEYTFTVTGWRRTQLDTWIYERDPVTGLRGALIGTYGAPISLGSPVGTGLNDPPVIDHEINLEYEVFAWSTELTKEAGVPPGTPGGAPDPYYALFNCEKAYPYFDRGMYLYTSQGGRYVGSELAAPVPASAVAGTYYGWA